MDAFVALLASVAPAHWLALGLVLLIAEMASGTTYLLWPAVAAGITGAVAWLAPGLDWPLEMALFAVLVIALTAFGRPLVRSWRTAGDAPMLNERGAQRIGARGAAANDFVNGLGTVRLNDSVWRAKSAEPVRAGAPVEVLAVEGATLSVKPVG